MVGAACGTTRLLTPSQPGSLSKVSVLSTVFGGSSAAPLTGSADTVSSNTRHSVVVPGRIALANVRSAFFTASLRLVALIHTLDECVRLVVGTDLQVCPDPGQTWRSVRTPDRPGGLSPRENGPPQRACVSVAHD